MKKKLLIVGAVVSAFCFSALLIWGMSRDVKAERKARNLVQSFLQDEGLGEQIRVLSVTDRGITGLSVEMSASSLLPVSELEMREMSHRIGNYLKAQIAKPASISFRNLDKASSFEMTKQDFKTGLFLFGVFGLVSLASLYFFRERKISRYKAMKSELLSREIEVRDLVVKNEIMSQEVIRLKAKIFKVEKEAGRLKGELSGALHLWEDSNLNRRDVEARYRQILVSKESLEEKIRLMRNPKITPEDNQPTSLAEESRSLDFI
ncbi:MAG: hypothetical protein AB7O96_12110 [Pseudobdellovibrionaceae bacterium]